MRFAASFFLFLFFFRQNSFAQGNSYERVDSIMRSYKEKIKSADDLFKVVYFIRQNFIEDSIRLRASFIWITDNINYDVEAYQKDDPTAARLDYVVKKKKAICSGYSNLLKFFCDAFNIENEIVVGAARASKRDVNIAQRPFRINHSWNVVKVNDQWRLIDPTWAAGAVDDSDEANLRFVKGFSEIYYFTPPEKFALNHFPKIPKHQLVQKAININQFSKSPLYLTSFLGDSISKVSPDTALIKLYVGDTLHIKLKTNTKSNFICAYSPIFKKANYSNFAINKDEWLEFDYPVTTLGGYDLFIGYCLNNSYNPLMVYRLQVEQKKK